MRPMAIMFCVLALPVPPAAAQDRMTDEIKGAFSQINNRLDAIEGRLQVLEDRNVEPTPVQHNSSASQPQARPGWQVDVLPYTPSGPADYPIARLEAPIGPVRFDLHLKNGPIYNQVSYRGMAFLKIENPGKYTFQLRTVTRGVEFTGGFGQARSGGTIDIEDKPVIGEFSDTSGDVTLNGSINLQHGVFSISYRAYCLYDLIKPFENLMADQLDDLSRCGYDITVLGPNDAVFRPFSASELFFVKPQ